MSTTDAAFATRMLERAIAQDARPALDATALDDLMEVAHRQSGGTGEYTDAGLNAAASLGWRWKAGLTADQYDQLGAGGGRYLKREDWTARCHALADMYASGQASVLDGGTGAAAGAAPFIMSIPYLTGCEGDGL